MNPLFSLEARRNPYPFYAQFRGTSPVFQDPQSRLWMLFDYQSVKSALSDHESFSSRLGPAQWMIFLDPPRHSKLRALISQVFTPRSVANLEPRIRELVRQLLDRALAKGELDLADEFSVPLPMMVIAEMLGVPAADYPTFEVWNNVMLQMSYTLPGGEAAAGKAE